ncbi:MAG: ecsA [Verrucomicrobia bacterium]|nr:ecsA [Verrucomicrobiota bacterium]
MNPIVETKRLTKTYGPKIALNELDLTIDRQRVVGLIGQNGSGKTTLLALVAGTAIASEGMCRTLGTDSARLEDDALSRIGVVFQENRFLDWMRVDEHLAYFGSFYKNWDVARQASLLEDLDLDPKAKVGHLSGGDVQKLGIITAVCHHPKLLLLDEPVSSLDPIARESLLKFIMRLLDEDDVTIIVSSHALMDIERLVDWVICLDQGNLKANSPLDVLQERFAEWRLTSTNGVLPETFREGYIRQQMSSGRQANLIVENADHQLAMFREKYHVDVTIGRLNLERIYPLLLKSRP